MFLPVIAKIVADPPPSNKSGRAFTFLELLIVLFLMAMLGVMAAPRFSGIQARQRIDASARRIATDLSLARRQARNSGAAQRVIFSPTNETYSLPDMPDPDHPDQTYIVRLYQEPYGTSIHLASLGGDSEIVFDGFGVPDSGGTVVIGYGNHQQTVTIDTQTGHSAVRQSLPEDGVVEEEPEGAQ